MKRRISISIVAVLLLTLFVPLQAVFGQYQVTDFGASAYEHTVYMSTVIGAREAGTEKEVETREYITNVFKSLGYIPEVQEFVHVRTRNEVNTEYPSANVIAVKKGQSSKEIIVGAHYDTKTNAGQESESMGADDNASGVGVMLEMAEKLKDIPTKYTIVFIAFGAEEVGLGGSYYHASQMSNEDIENTIAMINLDTILAGDKLYIYGGADSEGWIRDQALSIAEDMKLPIGTNPGLNEDYPEGTTGPWSDHAPFEELGIPFAYFEATNWEIGDLDGYDQSEKFGSFFHTSMDNLEFFLTEFPGRAEANLEAFATVLYNLLMTITPPGEEVIAEEEPIVVPAQVIVKYTVVSGDALWKIARKHDTTVAAILKLNVIKNPDLIFPGQVFTISVQ